MKRKLFAIVVTVATMAIAPERAARASEPLTKSCSVGYEASDLIVRFASSSAANAVLAVIGDPSLDPDLYRRLASPKSGRFYSNYGYTFEDGYFVYDFDALVNMPEVAAGMLADPVLAQRGLMIVQPDYYGCQFGVLPDPGRVTLTEYHNRSLDHYFLSSSTVENQAIDSGAAGPGWERTGETFLAASPNSCGFAGPVFRFYGAGPNSHFFTVDPGECGILHNTDPGWQFEAVAFGALLPSAGACMQGWRPVYRLYNDGFVTNNSNHRYVVRADLYAQMQAEGWIGEGVTMCLPVK